MLTMTPSVLLFVLNTNTLLTPSGVIVSDEMTPPAGVNQILPFQYSMSLMSVLNLKYPIYGFSGLVKLSPAGIPIASCPTICTIPVLPASR